MTEWSAGIDDGILKQKGRTLLSAVRGSSTRACDGSSAPQAWLLGAATFPLERSRAIVLPPLLPGFGASSSGVPWRLTPSGRLAPPLCPVSQRKSPSCSRCSDPPSPSHRPRTGRRLQDGRRCSLAVGFDHPHQGLRYCRPDGAQLPGAESNFVRPSRRATGFSPRLARSPSWSRGRRARARWSPPSSPPTTAVRSAPCPAGELAILAGGQRPRRRWRRPDPRRRGRGRRHAPSRLRAGRRPPLDPGARARLHRRRRLCGRPGVRLPALRRGLLHPQRSGRGRNARRAGGGRTGRRAEVIIAGVLTGEVEMLDTRES